MLLDLGAIQLRAAVRTHVGHDPLVGPAVLQLGVLARDLLVVDDDGARRRTPDNA